MQISGQAKGKYRNFKCAANHSKGDPVQVNTMLRARFEPIVLTPTADAWLMKTALKVEPAALVAQSGRKVFLEGVAGTGFEPVTFGL